MHLLRPANAMMAPARPGDVNVWRARDYCFRVGAFSSCDAVGWEHSSTPSALPKFAETRYRSAPGGDFAEGGRRRVEARLMNERAASLARPSIALSGD